MAFQIVVLLHLVVHILGLEDPRCLFSAVRFTNDAGYVVLRHADLLDYASQQQHMRSDGHNCVDTLIAEHNVRIAHAIVRMTCSIMSRVGHSRGEDPLPQFEGLDYHVCVFNTFIDVQSTEQTQSRPRSQSSPALFRSSGIRSNRTHLLLLSHNADAITVPGSLLDDAEANEWRFACAQISGESAQSSAQASSSLSIATGCGQGDAAPILQVLAQSPEAGHIVELVEGGWPGPSSSNSHNHEQVAPQEDASSSEHDPQDVPEQVQSSSQTSAVSEPAQAASASSSSGPFMADSAEGHPCTSASASSSSPASSSHQNQPGVEGGEDEVEQVCHYFAKRKLCPHGDDCRYAHDDALIPAWKKGLSAKRKERWTAKQGHT